MTHLYRHILIATDLSGNSSFIAKRAYEIAQFTKAKLSIVHVLPHTIIPYAGEFSIPIDAEFDTTLRLETKKQLNKLAKRYHIADDAQYLQEGSVKLAVTELAREISADLIVVGTHGREGLEILLGSQANAILHAASCDVWVMHINNSGK